ncbi:MAG: nucleoside-diphosphate kinase [Verrucomicrobiota bacterium]|nr:nucleoside-diphosphate kinase [Verrucomicrobiota bacterium]
MFKDKDLAYVILTPYTIEKSRTGAVLSRLLGNLKHSELVAARIFAPTQELTEQYAEKIRVGGKSDKKYLDLLQNYVLKNFGPKADDAKRRVLMLIFAGHNTRQELSDIVGQLNIKCYTGEKIRDAFGDLIWNEDGSLHYFEPAVLISNPRGGIADNLKLWLDFAKESSSVLDNTCSYQNSSEVEQTLVLIKPDNWQSKSLKPGAIVDMFSRTGLRIISCNICKMSIGQALEFYGPVKEILCKKLAPVIGKKAVAILEKEFNVTLEKDAAIGLSNIAGRPYALAQYASIIEFMTGKKPHFGMSDNQMNTPGSSTIMALVYEGENAVSKIRTILGPTDPTKAPSGTVRKEFGSNVMVNTAHASDSSKNAQREMKIMKMHEGTFVQVVENILEHAE